MSEKNKKVESVRIIPASIVLKKGRQFYGLHSIILPVDATNKNLVWSSSNPTIASVNADGVITAKSDGTTIIYATNQDSGNRGSIRVTVATNTYPKLINLIQFDKTTLMLEVGNQQKINPIVGPAEASEKNLDWYSSNEEVASVNNVGEIVACGQGTAKIFAYARDGSGQYCYCNVAVAGFTPVKAIEVLPSSMTMNEGHSSHFFAVRVYPSNATNKEISWSSSDTSIATINPISGLVIAQNHGTAILTATACDGSGVTGMCNLTVLEHICVENITVDPVTTLYRGNMYQMTATVCPQNATNKAIRWESCRPDIASIDAVTGVLTAKNAGQSVIYAISKDKNEIQGQYTVTVLQTVKCAAEESPENKIAKNIASVPVDVYSGAHMIKNTILSLAGGQNLSFVAHYNSTQLAQGNLGSGWYHNYEKRIEVNGCEAYVYSNPSIFSKYVAESECCSSFRCVSADKQNYVITVDFNCEYPYVLNCNFERTEYYNSNGDLAKVVDHHGFETIISYSDSLITITDSVSGKHIYLAKDESGKIIRVSDDAARQVTISYLNEFLTQICDVCEHKLVYTYDEEGRVKSGIDAENICFFENTYDEYGRVTEQKDAIAGSLKTRFEYDDNKRITFDRNGHRSVREYDENGLLICITDENGNSNCFTYDEHCNIIEETDAKGNSVKKSYNNFNKPTEVVDKNGNKTLFFYDTAGNIVKIQYPMIDCVIPEETFVYNGRNQMIRHKDLRGTTTVYTYDANGMPATKKVGARNAIVYSYENGLLKSVTDAMNNTTEFTYNVRGHMLSKKNASNQTTSYEYDAMGNLLKVTDANGKTIVNIYDGNYQKTFVTDANDNTTQYFYNGNLKNYKVILPDNNDIHYEYDGEDRVTKIIDQANQSTEFQYDAGGRLSKKILPDGGVWEYGYDSVGNIVREKNPLTGTLTKTYDKIGNVLTVKDSFGNVTSYQYNAMSKVSKMTNAVSKSTIYEYSEAGDLLKETDALGYEKTYTYDDYGNLLTATDARGHVTTYTYDANNNLLTVKDALNHVTTYTYNEMNQCVAVKDALNHTIQYGYDALGRRTTITDARGNVFTTVYDANGNVLKTIDAKGNTISESEYNCLNLPYAVTDALEKITTYIYDERGKVESITDAMNHQNEYSYDACGRNTTVKDATNHTSTVTYDKIGNVTQLIGPLGGKTEYGYDIMGRLTSESTVSGGTKRYTYNALNLRKTLTNARGQVREFVYDALGRIDTYKTPEGTVKCTYDANGNVLSVVDSKGAIRRTYDALNRVTSYTDTYGKTIRYEYDAVGNLYKLTYPDNTVVTHSYDENNNLLTVTDWANRVTRYTYDVNNRVTGITKPNGSTVTTVYDDMQRVTSTVEKTAGGVVITGFEYTYDDLSRIVEEKHLDKNRKLCYTYDNLNRVIKRTVKNLSNAVLSEESYSYDAAGNLIDAPDSCFAYDTNNRLTTFNCNCVSYDADGNMLNNGELSFSYDSANRLTYAGGHTYTYNAEDVRIKNLCSDATTTYTYDTNCKLSRMLQKTTNGITTKYVYGLGLIGEEKQGCFKTYHFDCRGSTIAITDANGNITDTFAYDTYGNLTSRTGTSFVIFGYNGRDGVVTDKNSLIYMRARYYSPEMRRFINADIIPGKISNAVTLNRYAYANSNPAMYVDPTGLHSYSLEEQTRDWHRVLLNEMTQEEYNEKYGINTGGSSITTKPNHSIYDDTKPDYVDQNQYKADKYKEKINALIQSQTKADETSNNNVTTNSKKSKRKYDFINQGERIVQNYFSQLSQIFGNLLDSVTIDIGIGSGIGGSVEFEGIEATMMLRGDVFAIQRMAGGPIFIGQVSETYVSAEALHSAIQTGVREVYNSSGELVSQEFLEPAYNDSSEVGISLYLLYGATIKVGIDWNYFYQKTVSNSSIYTYEDFFWK